MASYRDLLKAAKSDIREIDPETAGARLNDSTFLDVRELDEYEQGMIPGSVFIPRGHLEAQAENKLPDRDAPLPHDGREVGRVTSAAHRADGTVVALAYVRTEVPDDAPLALAARAG